MCSYEFAYSTRVYAEWSTNSNTCVSGTDKSRSVEIQKDNKCGWSVRIWSNMEYVSRISVRDWCSTGLSFWECINWVYVELNDGTSIEREYVSKIHSLLLNSLLMELMHSPIYTKRDRTVLHGYGACNN